MAQKPSIPKGTRDFNPEQVAKRRYIFSTIQNQFEKFGFQPIETPSFENSETLMGKYGDEGDRLIFKILNSGDYFEKFKNGIGIIDDSVLFFEDLIFNLVKEFSAESSISYEISDYNQIESFLDEIEKNNIFIELYELQYSVVLRNNKITKATEEFLGLIKNRSRKSILNFAFYTYLLNTSDWKSLLPILIKGEYLNHINSSTLTSEISEKALRYDLTVPFARYVVQHQNEIEFPFKRYQIQPVWRADRPQKGRFREFYQCDADVVGSTSLWQEVEFVQLYDAVFTKLGLEGTVIKINNRKILSGIAEVIGAKDKLIDFTVALDKLDKIGEEKVKEEMCSKGISEEGVAKLQPLFSISGSFETQIELLKPILSSSNEGLKGIEELEFISKAISELGLKSASLQLDVTLARGLNYYTGAIFEVAAPQGVKMGSIGGGGRYDDLTGIFGLKDVSGVGISFGLDRIYLVLEELNLFPETISKSTEVLFINFGEQEALVCLKTIKRLRDSGIKAELYPEAAKMKKQMNYANKRNIPFVVLVGEQEIASETFALKNMVTGEQSNISIEELIKTVQ